MDNVPDDAGSSTYITRGLLGGLLEMAAATDPDAFEATLDATPAGELSPDPGLGQSTPVLTHFYLPSASDAVSAVFGFDLSTGPGQTDGRFLSHPFGELGVSSTDDLHGNMVVAIPPWDESSVAAFDRRGRRQELTIVDAEPPVEALPDELYSR